MILYTEQMFKEFLIGELFLGYDPIRISQSAYYVDSEPSYNIPEKIRDILYTLMMMEMGAEFYLSEEKINGIIESLDKDNDKDNTVLVQEF
jgi:hypothetical protein